MNSAEIDLQHQFYDMLMQSQYWSAERMRDYQRSQLAQLLRHARKNVPFYENRLDAVLKPSGDIDWDRWGEIPIVKRSDLAEHGEAMVARELPRGHGKVRSVVTSGTTASRLTLATNTLAGTSSRVSSIRGYSWHSVDWTKAFVTWLGDDPNVAAWPRGQELVSWAPPWLPEATQGRNFKINRMTPPDRVLEFLKQTEAGYLSVRPKAAQYLALEAARTNSRIELGGVVTFSTATYQDERDDCRASFGCEMFGPYSSKEGGVMAYECAHSPHLHINEETVLVEILNARGEPCTEGEMGEVVVTPFYSTAQPLIRYSHGDLACLVQQCTCGRSLRTMSPVVGRAMDLFSMPDGRRIALSIPKALQYSLGARQWQVAQIGPLQIEVRYVSSGQPDQSVERPIVDIIRDRTDPEMQVTFRRQEELFSGQLGKFTEYVCEL